jgi:hypothetical protein
MSLIETTISVLGGGVIGYFIKYYLDLQLAKQSQAIVKKREVYEEIATALGVFVQGRSNTIDDKKRFLENFSKLWLWAPDPVIRAANNFSDIMTGLDAANTEQQESAKCAYAAFMIEMRKDLGFSRTSLGIDEYRFVRFGH